MIVKFYGLSEEADETEGAFLFPICLRFEDNEYVLLHCMNPSFADAEIFENHLCVADIYLHLKRAYFCGNFTFVVSYHVEQYYFTSLTQAKSKL